ncbi:hypothetical protein Acid345_0013 [Candidatus Koribacter versatilis Ellin345]|uniref:Uncharacterized protein n=1 Tax=Koribacter versatilis (strain Ellin345) TaxID=204669 RepID=Q1IVT2_KORVE|nr:hypothetical protein [Candidatus Koribacter versatilis]ABF39018.1 hypothetical protein Acid345_0013 [Candidatus Koribacter versatilis Ellin345]
MHSKFRLFALASAVAAFAALPVAAQNQGSHGGSGGGGHATSTSHSGNWAGGAVKVAGPSHGNNGHNGNGDHGGGNGGHNGHDNNSHRNNNNGFGYGSGYGYGGTSTELPYDSEYGQLEGHGTFDHGEVQEQPDNRVGPTIFEHNGQASGAIADNRSSAPIYREQQPSYDEPAPVASSLDDSPNPTILVFRDGHQQEVSNYAIAGTHLIVLGSKTQRLLLTDLDLSATSKVNADRGVNFKMPQN